MEAVSYTHLDVYKRQGVETFLEHFLKMTTSPLPRHSSIGEISPFDDNFSAFVFKIQANMNKAHRDRIAFMRICSGKFEAGMEVNLSLIHISCHTYKYQPTDNERRDTRTDWPKTYSFAGKGCLFACKRRRL